MEIQKKRKEKRTIKSELNRRIYFYQLLVTSKHKDRICTRNEVGKTDNKQLRIKQK